MYFFTKYTVIFRQIYYKYEQIIFIPNISSSLNQTDTLFLASISFRKIALKILRTRG